MAMKLFLLVLLAATAIYAVPTPEQEYYDGAEVEMYDEPDDDDYDEKRYYKDDDDDEVEQISADAKNKKLWESLWNKNGFCVCTNLVNKSGHLSMDEKMTQQDVKDGIAEHLKVHDEAAAEANYKAETKKLIAPYFKAYNLRCFCTRDKLVLSLMHAGATYDKAIAAKERFIKYRNLLKQKAAAKKSG